MNPSQFRVTGNSFKLVHSQYNQRNNYRKIMKQILKNQTQTNFHPLANLAQDHTLAVGNFS